MIAWPPYIRFERKKKDTDWQMEKAKVVTYSVVSLRKLYKGQVKRVDSYKAFQKAYKGARVVVLGKVARKTEVITRQDKPMWMLSVEDYGDVYPMIFWSGFIKQLEQKGLAEQIDKDSVILVSGFKGKSPKGELQLTLGGERGCYVRVLKPSV